MSFVHSLKLESAAELLKVLRAPEYMVPTLVFPVAFYTMFGVVLAQGQGASEYLLATYGVFAVMGPAIFGFGVAVASERDRGWLDLKRASPAHGFSYILAKIFVTLLVCALAISLVYAVAGFAGGVQLPRATWALLFLVHILATLPFILIGLTIGFSVGSNAAVALANLVFMGLAILGGLWFPMRLFPQSLQMLAQALPSYHLGEISLIVVATPAEHNLLRHMAVILFMTVLLGIVSGIAWKRQRD